MANVIKNYRATATGSAPPSLQPGQFGINELDGRFFYRGPTGTVTGFTFGAVALLSGADFTGNIGVTSTLPFFRMRNTAAPADARLWETYVDTSGALIGRVTNDAYSAAANWMQVSRAGAVATGVYFPVPLNFKPAAVATPANNGDLTVEATSNSVIRIRLKGTDGVVRSVSLMLM